MKLAEYLGRTASDILQVEPFRNWPIEQCIDDDSNPPLVGYLIGNGAIQINCDRQSENVRSVFLTQEAYDGTLLSEIPFNFSRGKTLEYLGATDKSGSKFIDPILGEFGPWDRFRYSGYTIHVQYSINSESIAKVTLMRNDVAP